MRTLNNIVAAWLVLIALLVIMTGCSSADATPAEGAHPVFTLNKLGARPFSNTLACRVTAVKRFEHARLDEMKRNHDAVLTAARQLGEAHARNVNDRNAQTWNAALIEAYDHVAWALREDQQLGCNFSVVASPEDVAALIGTLQGAYGPEHPHSPNQPVLYVD